MGGQRPQGHRDCQREQAEDQDHGIVHAHDLAVARAHGFHNPNLPDLLGQERLQCVDHQEPTGKQRKESDRAQKHQDRFEVIVGWMLAWCFDPGVVDGAPALFHLTSHLLCNILDMLLVVGLFGDDDVEFVKMG